MSKAAKLQEARFFLNKMRPRHPLEFDFYLSAFLTASRSVLQYMEKEVQSGSQAAQAWYRETMAASTVLQFFREERNRNIHQGPVRTAMNFHTSIESGIEETLPDGSKSRRPYDGDPAAPIPDGFFMNFAVTMDYYFDDWQPQSVLELCDWYVEQLEEALGAATTAGHVGA